MRIRGLGEHMLVPLESTSSHGGFPWLSESEIQVDLFPFCLVLMSFIFGLLILVWSCLMIIWSCFTEEEDAPQQIMGVR